MWWLTPYEIAFSGDKIDPHLDIFLEDFKDVVLSADLEAPG